MGWVFDLEGEEGFRDREEKVINELTEKQGIMLATGGGSMKSAKRVTVFPHVALSFILKRPSKSTTHAA